MTMSRLGARPTLLFFTARTSGPGRRMDSLIAHYARKERDRVEIFTIDVDQHGDLVERLAVGEIPSLVLLKDGRPVDRLEGRATGAQIEELIGAHIAS